VNWWLLAFGVLLVGGLGPGLWLALRGPAAHRLVGLELTGSVAALAMMLWCQAIGQASFLIVPVVLVLLSFAGTLVFTRLLGPHR
jgi:multisubunit Na+/H+ antiporter MnhF subunit